MKLNKKGVSLPELLAIIVIMGLIAAIAFPAFGVMITNAEKNTKVVEVKALVDRIETHAKENPLLTGPIALSNTDLKNEISANGVFGSDVYNIEYRLVGTKVYIDFSKANINVKVLDFSNDGCSIYSTSLSDFDTMYKTSLTKECLL